MPLPLQVFKNGLPPVVGADWLNEVDQLKVVALGNAQTAAEVRIALGLPAAGGAALIGSIRAGAGAVLRTVQARLDDTPIDPKDFGGGPDKTGVQNAAAFALANTAATAQNKAVRLSGGTWTYKPSARLDLTCDWYGEDKAQTIISCDTAVYSGVFFRVTASYAFKDLSLFCLGATKLGTGLQLGPVDINTFTGYMHIGPLHVNGFAKNFDVYNTFLVLFDEVRSDGGTEGFFCEPADVAGDNGYITTHHHVNCNYLQNDRNMHYKTPINSHGLLFSNVAIEGATGAGPQADFENIQQFVANVWFMEGAAGLRAATFVNCKLLASGVYLNGTGGLDFGMGSNVADISNLETTSASDVIVADGTTLQSLILRNSTCAAAGNTLNASRMQFINTTIDGVLWRNAIFGGMEVRETYVAASNEIFNIDSFVYTWVAGGTVNAGTTTAINDIGRTGCFTKAQGVANIESGQGAVGALQTGLVLSVAPATTGSVDFFCLLISNVSGGNIAVPAGTKVRVTFTRFKT